MASKDGDSAGSASVPYASRVFSSRPESLEALESAVKDAVSLLKEKTPKSTSKPFTGGSHEDLMASLSAPFEEALRNPSKEAANKLLGLAVESCVPPFHPAVCAHLHTPVLNTSIKAEVILSSLNQSMDSLDQSGVATLMELRLIDWLVGLAGFPTETSGGTITSGGTMSNYFAVLLALHNYLKRKHNWDTRTEGLPPHLFGKLRILTSEISHFSVEKSALQLGLGTKSVVKVPVDPLTFTMDSVAASRIAQDLVASGHFPFLIVGTASTTDFGSFDPLTQIASIAKEHGMWFHVDAAYGSACLLSPELRGSLAGLELADSVTMDFHKAFFQPVSCGSLIVRDKSSFDVAMVYSDYLNSETRADQGIPDLVNWSLMTTRRFDAAKMIATIAEIGSVELGKMVTRLWDLAVWTRDEMDKRSKRPDRKGDLIPLHQPAFGCLVFRYLPRSDSSLSSDDSRIAKVNAEVPALLFERGTAVVGHTRVHGVDAIKFTFNNPAVLESEVTAVIDLVESCGDEVWEKLK